MGAEADDAKSKQQQEQQLATVREHSATAVRSCAKMIRAHASALQLERRGKADLPTALAFSPLYGDILHSWWTGTNGVATSAVIPSRSELEAELTAARNEGMEAVQAMGAALFPSPLASAGREDAQAALTFVSLCMALRHSGGQQPLGSVATSTSPQSTPNTDTKSMPPMPPNMFYGMRGLSESVSDIQRQLVSVSTINVAKQVSPFTACMHARVSSLRFHVY